MSGALLAEHALLVLDLERELQGGWQLTAVGQRLVDPSVDFHPQRAALRE